MTSAAVMVDPRAVRAIVEFRAQQKVAELTELLYFLESRRIRTVLEIGSRTGGTLWLWTQIAERVVSIDLTLTPQEHLEKSVWMVVGDSHEHSTLLRLPPTSFDMLFIDGDHSYAGVKRDYEMYGPMVSADGVVVFHDIVTVADGGDESIEVDRFWSEVKQGREWLEFVTPVDIPISPPIHPRSALPRMSAGIGVLLP